MPRELVAKDLYPRDRRGHRERRGKLRGEQDRRQRVVLVRPRGPVRGDGLQLQPRAVPQHWVAFRVGALVGIGVRDAHTDQTRDRGRNGVRHREPVRVHAVGARSGDVSADGGKRREIALAARRPRVGERGAVQGEVRRVHGRDVPSAVGLDRAADPGDEHQIARRAPVSRGEGELYEAAEVCRPRDRRPDHRARGNACDRHRGAVRRAVVRIRHVEAAEDVRPIRGN